MIIRNKIKIILFILLGLSLISCGSNEFISVWNTEEYGRSNSNQIQLPLVINGKYDFWVNWGDRKKDHIVTWDDPARIHDYENPGIYTIKLKGKIEGWSFFWNYNKENLSNTLALTEHKPLYVGIIYDDITEYLAFFGHNIMNDQRKILEIEQWGSLSFGDTDGQFVECENLSITATDVPDLSKTSSLVSLFLGCESLNNKINIQNWDVSSIQDFRYAFAYTDGVNANIEDWNVSNAMDMAHMFDANVVDYEIALWDTSNVKDMNHMFLYCENFNEDLSKWNVSKVENMSGMFQGAKKFNQDLSEWDVSSVTNMNYMFSGALLFNQDVSSWDVSNVTDMGAMFWNAGSFNQDLSTWDFSNVQSMEGFLEGAKISTKNYDSLLISLSAQNIHHNLDFHGGNSQYSAKAIPARNKLIMEYGWIITDGGEVKVSQNQ